MRVKQKRFVEGKSITIQSAMENLQFLAARSNGNVDHSGGFEHFDSRQIDAERSELRKFSLEL